MASIFSRLRQSLFSSPASRSFRSAFWRRLTQFEALETRYALSTLPPGFQEELFVDVEAVNIAFAPDGHIFAADKNGTVRVLDEDGTPYPTPFFTVPVDTYRDRGLTEAIPYPNFKTNRYVYIFYTVAVPNNPNVAENGAYNKLIRITAREDNHHIGDTSTIVTILTDIPSPTGIHQGGFMHFGLDGMFYVGIGEGDVPQLTQDMSSISGKMLRLNMNTYPNIVPADNPYVGVPGIRPEIWATGFRNPYSGNIDPVTGRIYVNDVGSSLWEEVNELVRGGNYGWPIYEGDENDPNYINPIFAYSHNGGGGAAATAGVFYRGTQFPPQYQGKYFAGDVAQSVLRLIDPATNSATPWSTNTDIITDIDVGPDGSLYWTSAKPFASGVYKITYVNTTNSAPTAVASANVTDGLNPLTITFNGALSTDPDGDALFYSWNFGDGITGTGVSPTKTYTVNGTYFAYLTVTDRVTGGLSNTAAALTITVGNLAPQPVINTPVVGTTYQAGQTITFRGSATDAEDGVLPASAYRWSFLFGHNVHFHSGFGPVIGATSGSVTIDRTGEVDPDQFYRIILTVTDSNGTEKMVYRDVTPQLGQFLLTSNVGGVTLLLDAVPIMMPTFSRTGVIGMSRTISAPLTQVVGGVTYSFVGWTDGGAPTHSFNTLGGATTFTAIYQTSQQATYATSPPVNWMPGVAQTFNVTVTNNGGYTWPAGGANPVRLGVYFSGNSDAPYDWTVEPQRFDLPVDLAPGQSVTIHMTIAGPATPGTYPLRIRMVQEGVSWFPQLFKQTINNGAVQSASYASVFPLLWPAGETRVISVVLTNNGSTTWNTTGANIVNLGAYFGAPNDLPYTWPTEPVRFALPGPVAPGQTVTINVTLTAPTTPGDNTLRFRLVKEGIGWFKQLQKTNITIGTLAATYSENSSLLWGASETKTYAVTITNTGNITWKANGAPDSTAVNLGVYWDAPNDLPYSWPTEPIRFVLPNDVAPGQTVIIPVTVTAPPTLGNHTIRYRMVKLQEGWFDTVLAANAYVGTLSATYVSAAPGSWGLGATKVYNVTVTNTGNVTWNAAGPNQVQLGFYYDAPNDLPFTWATEPLRAALPNDVAPGASVTVAVTLTAPMTSGTFTLRHRLVKEGISWFTQLNKRTITTAVAGLAAAYYSVPPTSWATNQTVTYSVIVTNIGTQTWPASGINAVKLGEYFSGASDAPYTWPAEPKRFLLPGDVAPGQTVTLNIAVKAPATTGPFFLRVRMVQENIAWFDYFQKTAVTVNGLTASFAGTPPSLGHRAKPKLMPSR